MTIFKMNTNRSIDELLSLFNVRNISELGSDVIIKYFDDISVKEAMKLCRVNKQFNEVCKKESVWRNKVSYDYGIKKKRNEIVA
uniref:F-box family protein n=1 Tax=Pithovirus LCPAC401 TaxID=2506595 RepID=A0A481Z9T2_9VIRU|nr:MAG: F-box family protein [Pithovirus LCPAC401]